MVCTINVMRGQRGDCGAGKARCSQKVGIDFEKLMGFSEATGVDEESNWKKTGKSVNRLFEAIGGGSICL